MNMLRLPLVSGLSLFLLTLSAVASAHEDPLPPGKGSTSSSSTGPAAAEAPETSEPKEEEKEPDWEVAGDFVAGATTTDILNEGRPTRIEQPPQNVVDSTRITTFTLVAGVERKFGERFKLGARIPVIDAELRSRTGASDPRSTTLFGNLELEGAYVLARGKSWDVTGVLELALPTAGGSEGPSAEQLEAAPTGRFDYRAIDRFAGAHAASATRGAYESALFAPGRVGVVPKITAHVRAGKLTIAPTVKVENLMDVTGDAENGYVAELVGGVRLSYLVTPYFEPAVHAWTTIAYTETDAFDALVVEPAVRFPLGRITPQLGVILPVAGNVADDKSWGLRLAVAGEL